jgi:hypothetical protein
MEWWSNEGGFHHSNTPLLQYSTTPLLSLFERPDVVSGSLGPGNAIEVDSSDVIKAIKKLHSEFIQFIGWSHEQVGSRSRRIKEHIKQLLMPML